ncbi:4612_t:CDS:2, partial [Ambispora gerdemannii]
MNNTFDDTQWDQKSHSFRSSRKCHCPSGSEKKSFIWKYFIEKNNPSEPSKIMVCSLNLANDKPCQKTYITFSNTSNAIQYFASIHTIVEQGKLHIKYISLTTDLWTSHAKQGYIGITASFMDSDFKIYDILLELEYLPYPHIAKHIRDKIQLIIEKWSLQEKVIAIITDNESNMIKAISYLNNITRISCITHTLQLVIGKELAPVLVFISRAKYLNWFFTYPKQIERFQTTQTSLNYPKILDAIDQLAIDLSRDQDSTIKKDGCHLKKINLTDDEWIFMEHLVNLLGLFEEVTTFLSGNIYMTLSLMHPIISELQKVFEDETLL